MSLIWFRCSHCSNRFQAENKEGLECPRCFWSSSIHPEDEKEEPERREENGKATLRKPMPGWAVAFLAFILVAGAGLGVVYLAQKNGWFEKVKDFKVELTPQREKKKKSQEPESNPSVPSGTMTQAGNVASLINLTVEEREGLTKGWQAGSEAALTEKELEILSRAANFKTGFSESLPSQPWNKDNFNRMIKDQETFYKVPFPGSYRRKLDKHFDTHYLPGKTAFEAGDLLTARNHWVDALNIPQYSDKIERHRGVALTMLKPFINDTLSKIGAIHSALLEKQIRIKEEAVTQNYQKLLSELKNQNWKEASRLISMLYQLLEELDHPQKVSGEAPPYPPSISTIDAGIRDTLVDMLDIPTPAVSAFNEMRSDLADKNKIVNSRIPERVEEMKQIYALAMDSIMKEDWDTAEIQLKKIYFPIALLEDAQNKLRIIKKIKSQSTPSGTVGMAVVQGS